MEYYFALAERRREEKRKKEALVAARRKSPRLLINNDDNAKLEEVSEKKKEVSQSSTMGSTIIEEKTNRPKRKVVEIVSKESGVISIAAAPKRRMCASGRYLTICSTNGCENFAKKGGVCITHGAIRWSLSAKKLHDGDATEDYDNINKAEEIPPDIFHLRILSKNNRTQKPNGRWMCKIEGCSIQGRSDKDDLCKRHFTLFKKVGRGTLETGDEKEMTAKLGWVKRRANAADGQPPIRPAKNPIKSQSAKLGWVKRRANAADGRPRINNIHQKGTCSTDGCTNGAINNGVCMRHGAVVKMCAHKGCDKYAQRANVCWNHGARVIVKGHAQARPRGRPRKIVSSVMKNALVKRSRGRPRKESTPSSKDVAARQDAYAKGISCTTSHRNSPSKSPFKSKTKYKAANSAEKIRINNIIHSAKSLVVKNVDRKGVTCKPSGNWQAQVFYAGRTRYVGIFDSKEKASLAYDLAQKFLDEEDDIPTGKRECERKFGLARTAALMGVNK